MGHPTRVPGTGYFLVGGLLFAADRRLPTGGHENEWNGMKMQMQMQMQIGGAQKSRFPQRSTSKSVSDGYY